MQSLFLMRLLIIASLESLLALRLSEEILVLGRRRRCRLLIVAAIQ